MKRKAIETATEVYRFVDNVKSEAVARGFIDLCNRFEGALKIGSSSLEIMGAIRGVVVENQATIEDLLGSCGKDEIKQVIAFVDRAFGR